MGCDAEPELWDLAFMGREMQWELRAGQGKERRMGGRGNEASATHPGASSEMETS